MKTLDYAGPMTRPDARQKQLARKRKLIFLGKVLVCVGAVLTLVTLIYLFTHQPDERFMPFFKTDWH
ncbi:MAG TPA: hypothetical protein VH475_21465 [Tepidisphaeraceae bacterium]|jgi:hypothetical protein